MNFKLGLTWLALLLAVAAGAQTTTFTYQGQLGAGGSPASGNFDFRFRLFDGTTNVIAGPVTNAPVSVTNGLFTTTLNFGATNFNGSARALEIALRPNGNTNAYVVLAPNQPFTSTPYAIQSLNASNAVQLTAPLAATNLAGTLADSQLPANVALLSGNATFQGSVTAGSFAGSGAGLTGIPATSLTGTLPDANLSPDVALLSASATFQNNVSAVLFTGSGHGLTNVPGAFFWVTVPGTSASASSNIGYIVTNNSSPVTITLPSLPSVGDTYKVAGVGAGGWTIAQNSGQTILAGNLGASPGLNWTLQSSAGQRLWTGLAASADGTKLFAVCQGYIYVSSNSGASWSQEGSSQYWSAVACSSDGSHAVAVVGTASGTAGSLYTSADGGNTWTGHSPTAQWIACASSASGNNLIAASHNGYLYTSANAGSTWGQSYYNSAITWNAVASSADGTKLFACGTASGGSYVFTSSNSGGSWTQQTGSGLHVWSAITCSADGTRICATTTGGSIYASADGGVTWASQNLNSVSWTAITSSSDGSRLAAAYTGPGYIFTTANSGAIWAQSSGATNAYWIAITSSADGSKLAAASNPGGNGGYLYASGQAATTSGTAGYLAGDYQSTIELLYVGNGVFIPLNHEGTIRAY